MQDRRPQQDLTKRITLLDIELFCEIAEDTCICVQNPAVTLA